MHLVASEGDEHEKISAKSFGRYVAQFHYIFHRIFQFHYIHYITSTRKRIEIQITSTSQQPRAGAANLVNVQGIVDEIDHVLVVVGVGRGVGRTAEWGRGQCDAISPRDYSACTSCTNLLYVDSKLLAFVFWSLSLPKSVSRS